MYLGGNKVNKELILKAIEARENAYCPYSNFKVGALIGDVKAFAYPCGICRQVITEFAESGDMKIYIIKNENEVLETTLDEVMPGTFTKKDLEK